MKSLITVLVLLLFGTRLACAAQSKNVVVLATGGTIAGRAESASSAVGYAAGVLGVDELLKSVPEIRSYANVTGEQIANIDSKDMTDDIWLKLAGRVNEILERGDIDGVVITHGTDTMEETAYFLNLVVHSDKPVVITGAMRPATAVSADGPMNLLDAVRVAASPAAVGKGTLVVMGGTISNARDVVKTNTLSIGAFKSPELGVLGYLNESTPVFYRESSRRHTKASEFSVDGIKELPYVKIIYGHAGDDGILIDAAVKAGAKGIVYAGTGNGSVHRDAMTALEKASAQGVVIVRSSRVESGPVISAEESYKKARFIEGDTLGPQKSRILLALALTKTTDPDEIQRMFREY